jgi:hypothetical protein
MTTIGGGETATVIIAGASMKAGGIGAMESGSRSKAWIRE